MDIEKLIGKMTTEEKAALVSGTDFMYTNPIPRLGIPSLCMADGPHGLRKQTGEQDNGISQSEPATAFPTAVTAASSWNPETARRIGRAIGEECRYYGVHVLLGPGVNIKRNPLCGRNFEYFSEDPLLAGSMGTAEVQGVQSQGVGVSVKHFALNNSENYRFMGNSIVDERAAREIYLKAFEQIVKETAPASMMCAYNQINGTYCSENRWLLTKVLRKEWGFDGVVMTDWGAMHNRVKSLKAGLDLEMPGDTAICRRWILDAVREGKLSMDVLDQAVRNILKWVSRYTGTEKAESADWEAHHALAARAAEDSAVLLKNNGILPLKEGEKILVAGELFEKMRYQGAGSSMIHPTRVTTVKDAFEERQLSYEYVPGYRVNSTAADFGLVREAVERAEGYDTVLVFAGLTDDVESEGCDRADMRLPENQLELIRALAETGKKTAVVLFGGSAVELPFADQVQAILHMFLPGQNGGTAAVRLLYGDANPSGRLAETWPVSYEDVPFSGSFGKEIREIYRESVYVGYRYYLTAGKRVRFPFGYGLSYTTFDYREMQVEETEEGFRVTCMVENTGLRDGAEVVQLYVSAPRTRIFKPEKELRAFRKVYVKAGESVQVTLAVKTDDLRYYHTGKKRWILEPGKYGFQLCRDCCTVMLSETVSLAGEEADPPYSPEAEEIYGHADLEKVTDEVFTGMSGVTVPQPLPSRPVTLESRFTDLNQSFFGRILFRAVLSVAEKQRKEAERMPEGTDKDNKRKGAVFLKRILESNSLISMSMSAGRSMPYHFACGFRELANGHLLRGIRYFLSPVRVPELPKDQTEKKKDERK